MLEVAHKASTRARQRCRPAETRSRRPHVQPFSFISLSTVLLQVSLGRPLFLLHLWAHRNAAETAAPLLPLLFFYSLQINHSLLRLSVLSWGLFCNEAMPSLGVGCVLEIQPRTGVILNFSVPIAQIQLLRKHETGSRTCLWEYETFLLFFVNLSYY